MKTEETTTKAQTAAPPETETRLKAGTLSPVHTRPAVRTLRLAKIIILLLAVFYVIQAAPPIVRRAGIVSMGLVYPESWVSIRSFITLSTSGSSMTTRDSADQIIEWYTGRLAKMGYNVVDLEDDALLAKKKDSSGIVVTIFGFEDMDVRAVNVSFIRPVTGPATSAD